MNRESWRSGIEEQDAVKKLFLDLLKNNAWGRGRAIPRSNFLEEIRRTYPAISDRTLRLMKEELVRAGEPVCSCEDGYYYPESASDIDHARSYLRAKANDLHEKIALLDKAAARKFGTQTAFEFAGRK